MTNILFTMMLMVFSSCQKNSEEPLVPPYIPGDAGLKEMPLWDPPETAIHIDPANTDDPGRDGSIDHPFISFEEVTWENNQVYALKRGTTLHTGTVMIFADSVTLASYGEGERPVINSSSDLHAVSTAWEGSHNITIRDIEVYAPEASSCVIFRTNSTNGKVINCKLHGAEWGLRALNHIDGLYVYNTEIFDIADDGMFIKNTQNIEIAHCYIHRVNQNWQPPETPEGEAAGDGIQFYLCNNWHVHHNIIDRSDTGNKFCFISNNPSQNNGILEKNLLIAPAKGGGAAVYIGDGTGLVIRYNHIKGPGFSPFYSHASGLKIYYNVFRNFSGPLLSGGSAEIFNNLFYNMGMGIEGGKVVAHNNIFDLGAVNRPRFKVNDLTESHNLFAYGLPTHGSFVGNPEYVDAPNGDFRPLPGSETIDEGKDLGFHWDKDGNPVPNGGAPDIGPFEFQKK